MTRIGASVSGFNARIIHQFSLLNQAIAQNNLRLATGKRINSARDDPAGLVAVNQLRAELASVEQASYNVTAAQSLVSTADTTLSQRSAI